MGHLVAFTNFLICSSPNTAYFLHLHQIERLSTWHRQRGQNGTIFCFSLISRV